MDDRHDLVDRGEQPVGVAGPRPRLALQPPERLAELGRDLAGVEHVVEEVGRGHACEHKPIWFELEQKKNLALLMMLCPGLCEIR